MYAFARIGTPSVQKLAPWRVTAAFLKSDFAACICVMYQVGNWSKEAGAYDHRNNRTSIAHISLYHLQNVSTTYRCMEGEHLVSSVLSSVIVCLLEQLVWRWKLKRRRTCNLTANAITCSSKKNTQADADTVAALNRDKGWHPQKLSMGHPMLVYETSVDASACEMV